MTPHVRDRSSSIDAHPWLYISPTRNTSLFETSSHFAQWENFISPRPEDGVSELRQSFCGIQFREVRVSVEESHTVETTKLRITSKNCLLAATHSATRFPDDSDTYQDGSHSPAAAAITEVKSTPSNPVKQTKMLFLVWNPRGRRDATHRVLRWCKSMQGTIL